MHIPGKFQLLSVMQTRPTIESRAVARSTGVKRVTTLKMLGVTVTNTLSVAEHVQAIIRACAPSIHALRVLRCHGLNDAALQTAYRAIIVARLTYAASAWWGFTTADDRRRVEGFFETRYPGWFLSTKLAHCGESCARR